MPHRGNFTAGLIRVPLACAVLACWILLCLPVVSSAAEIELSTEERAWLKDHPTIRLTPDPSFPPVEFFESGVFSGIAADYVAIIEEKLGIEFDIREVDSWSISVDQTKARQNDVWSAVAETPERKGYMVFSAPYINSPAVIIVRDDFKDALDVSDLKGVKVAVIKDYAIGSLLRLQHPDLTFVDVPDAATGLKRVSFGSLDAFIVNLAIASHTIRAKSFTNLRVAGDAGPVLRWRFAVRDDWPILRDLIDKALGAVSAEEHQAIRQRWIAFESSGFRIDSTVVAWGIILFGGLLFVGVLIWNRSLRQVVETRTAALRENESRIQTVVDNVIEGIITVDQRGIIRSVNVATETLFGAEADDLVGQHIGVLALREGDDGESHPLVEYIFSGEAHASGQLAEFEGVSHSGVRFPMEVGAREVVTDRDRFFVVILRDISERKEMDRLKSEFVSTVSHELRTPLTSIRGTLGLVMGGAVGELPKSAHEMVAIAERNTLRLLELVNDILDMEKIDSGRMDMNLKPLDIHDLVERALQDNRAYAEQFGVEFVLTPESISAMVSGDDTRLIQVMSNLLSNAAKFSPQGSKVTISIEDLDTQVRVLVADQGQGIPEEFREQLFERFTQADSSDKRQSGGTGLGLSISIAIVEAHGGRMDFESTVGEGTTFHFDLNKIDA